jgi:hypothetical protein
VVLVFVVVWLLEEEWKAGNSFWKTIALSFRTLKETIKGILYFWVVKLVVFYGVFCDPVFWEYLD